MDDEIVIVEKYSHDKKQIDKIIDLCLQTINIDHLIDKSFDIKTQIKFDEKNFMQEITNILRTFCDDNSWIVIEHDDNSDVCFKEGVIDNEQEETENLINLIAETYKKYLSSQDWNLCESKIQELSIYDMRKKYINEKMQIFILDKKLGRNLTFRKTINDIINQNKRNSLLYNIKKIYLQCNGTFNFLYLLYSSSFADSAVQVFAMLEIYVINYLIICYGPLFLEHFISSKIIIKLTIKLFTNLMDVYG
jgi:hypothetical protein